MRKILTSIIEFVLFKGEGTRSGSGKCNCESGYTGELCDQCSSGFYETSRTEDGLVCSGRLSQLLKRSKQQNTDLFKSSSKECNQACKSCSGPAASECLACRDGYKMNEDTKACDGT